MTKPFDRIITVMFENQYRSYVIQNPFFKKLAAAGADMTNYFGAFHPSQTNYIASLAGEVCAVTNDTPPASPLLQETLVDLLEAKKVSWKAYMEAYPGEPWKKSWKNPDYPATDQPITQYPPAGAKDLSRYYRKHNAFASFHTIQKSEERWKKIVGDAEFWNDIAHDTLPEYSWFTPDIWNDGHYLYNTHIDTDPRTQLVPQQATWLEHVFLGNIDAANIQGGAETCLPSLGLNLDVDLLFTDPQKAYKQSNIPKGTLVVVTFDEADYNAQGYDTMYDGPNQIYTVLLGDMITPGTVIDTPYNHYNLIRTVEENFQLGSLYKNDFGANWFRSLWNESYQWSKPIDTDFQSGNALAITHGKEGKHLAFSNSNGELFSIILSKNLSAPHDLGVQSKGVAFASINGVSVLVNKDSDNELSYLIYNATNQTWSSPTKMGVSTTGSFALTSYNDMAAKDQKLMLCWEGASGFIQSMQGNEKGFSGKTVPVNQLTDGAMTLGQLGASLFLVYKQRNTRKMNITSFNTGDFNAFEAHDFHGKLAPENNTSLHEWSVTDFTVGHFSKKMAALGNEYQHMGALAMATADGEMHLVHRAGYPDTPHAYTEIFGLTGIYSAANEFTNGYGTLDQAGWTLEKEMTDVSFGVDNPISMCSDGQTITLVWIDTKSDTIKYKTGTYQKT